MTTRLSPGIRPTAAQMDELKNSERISLSNVLEGSRLPREARERMLRTNGQAGVDREFRRFLMQTRPSDTTKHTVATSVEEARSISRGRRAGDSGGPAQFMPGLVRERVEARAIREMPGVYQPHGGTIFKYVKFDNAVGFDRGNPTHWMRVEITSDGIYHGHPMGFDRVLSGCSTCRQFGQ